MDATVGGWKSATQISGGTPVAIGVQTMRAIGRINGVNHERVAALLHATGGLVGALPPESRRRTTRATSPDAARAQVRLMIEALQDISAR